MNASVDFGRDCLKLFDQSIPLKVNAAGQYVVDLLGDLPKDSSGSSVKIMSMEPAAESVPEAECEFKCGGLPHTCADDESIPVISEEVQDVPLHVWFQENSGVKHIPVISGDGPKWGKVRRRVVKDVISGKVLHDHSFSKSTCQKQTLMPLDERYDHVMTEFHFYDAGHANPPSRNPQVETTWSPSSKQARRLQSQMHTCHEVCHAACQGKRGSIKLMHGGFLPSKVCTSCRGFRL